jgi:hypothetical protein
VATHENVVPRLSASDIVGRAVFVTLPSRADNNSGRHMAMKERQNPSVRFQSSEGVPETSEGEEGKVGRLSQYSLGSGPDVLGCFSPCRFGSKLTSRSPEGIKHFKGDFERWSTSGCELTLTPNVDEDWVRTKVVCEANGDCTAVSAREYWLAFAAGQVSDDRLEEGVDCGNGCMLETRGL